ncbi:hypothetical protein [Nakamurella deserti]|uniref:hypothetical protein n=1 Tax=Nakamurella deserti TaxID=2164074 RepID=UPI0013005922|nr:hypothetical protein [Nakamurella deserti]
MPFPSSVPSPAALAAGDLACLSTDAVVGSFVEPGGHTVVIAEPGARPDLWAAYLHGARESYRQHGVESALEFEQIRDGRSTALFAVAVDDTGRVVAGLRVQPRLARLEKATVLREWAGRPGTAEIRAGLALRLSSGVVEVRAVWVARDVAHRGPLTATVARLFVHAMDLLQVRFAVCTAAAHAVTRWQTSGGVVAADVPAVAYPDERYRTMVLWWDRTRVAELVSADQYDALTRESDLLAGRLPVVPVLSSVA